MITLMSVIIFEKLFFIFNNFSCNENCSHRSVRVDQFKKVTINVQRDARYF